MARKKVTLKKPVVRRSSQAASKKSIISTGTLVTVVVFAAVVLLGIYIARQNKTAEAEATPDQALTFLFNESDPILSSIEVVPGEGEAVKLARDEKNIWAFELPAKAEADQGLVEAAASQVFSLTVVDTLPTNAKPADFGLDKPAYVITLKFSSGKTYTLEVGAASPVGTGYYVRLDKGVIQLADLSGIDALTQLVTTPPYVATPTPLTTPTATALPPTETAVPTETASTPEATSETPQTPSTPEVTSAATSATTPEATSTANSTPTESISTPEASPTPTP